MRIRCYLEIRQKHNTAIFHTSGIPTLTHFMEEQSLKKKIDQIPLAMVKVIVHRRIKICHCLVTIMSFQTCMTDFL